MGYFYAKIIKSLNYLEFTYTRVSNIDRDPKVLSEEQMELWDSFAIRFARTSDLFLSKFIKAIVKRDDPAFDGGFRDYLYQCEKLGVLEDIPMWLEIRNLRNIAVHEYSDEDLKEIFKKLLDYSAHLFQLRSKLAGYVK